MIRKESPANGPRLREMLAITETHSGLGSGEKVGLITDGFFLGATLGFCVAHVCPLVANGKPLALLKDEISVVLSDTDLAKRKVQWTSPRETIYAAGALWKYAQLAGEVYDGLVMHPSGKAEKNEYLES